MSEDTAAAGAQQAETPANGTNGHAAAAPTPTLTVDEVLPPKGAPPEQASPEALGKMYDAVRAMTPEQQLVIKRALLKRLQEEVGESEPAAKGAAAPAVEEIDPGAFDAKMMRVPPPLPEFTREAMEKSAYVFKGKKVYPPFDGLLEMRIERTNGKVRYSYKLSAPFLCQNCYGDFVTVPRGKIFIVAASSSMRVQIDEAWAFQQANGGKCHVRCRPLGWGTDATGEEGILWDCRFQPETDDPDAPAEERSKPKLFERGDE